MRFVINTVVKTSTAAVHHMRRRQRWVLALAFAVVIVLTSLLLFENLRDRGPAGNNGSASEADEEDGRLENQFGAAASYSKVYFVSPPDKGGNDANSGTSADKALASINKAVSFAAGGDTIYLADGTYYQSIATVKDGTSDAPITIQGSRRAIVHGSKGQSRAIEIRHNFIHLQGFAIDGKTGQGDDRKDYLNKLLYVIGREPRSGVEGLRVNDMLIQNAGGECVRLRYFARNNEISNSTIKNCGVYAFKFNAGNKNGEGIYIGTAPEQRNDGKNPTADPDASTKNIIRNNQINTQGNECVDVKEAAFENLVEYNTCEGQLDKNSAGFDARGNNNTFRHNISKDNIGAGFRLGGDTDSDGIGNNVYQNTITNNKAGALKIIRQPQGKICDNELQDNANKNNNDYGIKPAAACQ